MTLGMRLHDLWHRRILLVVSLLVAFVAALFSAYRISLLPPALHPRAIGMAAASTQVLVDNPYSVVLDLNQGSDQLTQLAQTGTLLGTVMASLPVRQDIAHRIGVPVQSIQTTAPATPEFPQATASPQNRKTTDLIASNNQFRINIQSNPTVPILDIYTEAHSVSMAKELANAAVAGLSDYLSTVAQSVPAKQQVRLEQLGQPQAGAVTGGLRVEVMALVFLFAFLISVGLGVFAERVRRGWRTASDPGGPSRAPGVTNGVSELTPAEITRQAGALLPDAPDLW